MLYSEKEDLFERGLSRAAHRRVDRLDWYRIIGESIRGGFAEFLIATRFAYAKLDDVYNNWDQFGAGLANDRKTVGQLFEIYCFAKAKRNYIRTDWLNREFMAKYRPSKGDNLGLNDLYKVQYELFYDLMRTCVANGKPERVIESLNKFNSAFMRTEQGFVPTPTVTAERMVGMLADSITPETIIVDPVCGRGIFLTTARKLFEGRYKGLYGIDRDVGRAYLAAAFFEPNSNSRIVDNIFVRDALTIRNYDKEIFMPKGAVVLSDVAGAKQNPSRVIFVGNPPYQEMDKGDGVGGAASPLYQKFITKAREHGDGVLFIIPAKWYSSGKGLDQFRRDMLTCGKVKEIIDFPNTSDVFNANITGGICIIHIEQGHNGPTRFTQSCAALSTHGKPFMVDLSRYDILVRDPLALPILSKILQQHHSFMSETVSSRKPFGLSTNFKEFCETGGLPVMTRTGMKRVSEDRVTIGLDILHKWKTYCSRASGGDAQNTFDHSGQKGVLGIAGVLAPGELCLETYLIAESFDKQFQAKYCAEYLLTKFSRFLLGLRKIDQNISNDRFAWVPKMDFTRSWTDRELYDHFGLTVEERNHIEATIRSIP